MHSPLKLNENKLNRGRLKMPANDEKTDDTRKKWYQKYVNIIVLFSIQMSTHY